MFISMFSMFISLIDPNQFSRPDKYPASGGGGEQGFFFVCAGEGPESEESEERLTSSHTHRYWSERERG